MSRRWEKRCLGDVGYRYGRAVMGWRDGTVGDDGDDGDDGDSDDGGEEHKHLDAL